MTFYKSRKYAAQFLLKLSENQKCPYLIVEVNYFVKKQSEYKNPK